MSLPRPYERADDATLSEGCLHGDPDAWDALLERYRSLIHAVVVRALDVPRPQVPDHEPIVDHVFRRLRDGALAQWRGESQLRSYLAHFARRVARRLVPPAHPGPLVAAFPTPSGIYLDDLLAIEPAARVQEALDRFPPHISALVRLRIRGLTRADIAATLGMSPAAVRQNLEHFAGRLGERDDDASLTSWRALLDAAEIEEQVTLAAQTVDDPELSKSRALVEKTWRTVGDRALARPVSETPECLDERALAGFVDGTLRGPARARAEGHVTTCRRCMDETAALVLDLRMAPLLREAHGLPELLAVAGACVATMSLRAADHLLARADKRGLDEPCAADLRRLVRVGSFLTGGGGKRREASSVAAPTHVPEREEAPLLAFEALVLGSPEIARRAIDDDLAKRALGARLRLLAAAAGPDVEASYALAQDALDAVDPELVVDGRAVLALAGEVALPEEILFARLRSILPEVVRHVLSRPRVPAASRP